MNVSRDFPRLTPANYRVTSPTSIDYNCVAWAAEDVGELVATGHVLDTARLACERLWAGGT
jgi:hypothetical protein